VENRQPKRRRQRECKKCKTLKSIAWPIAYYIINQWQQNFAYKIGTTWWIFILSGGITLVIALLTISYQAIKAAVANPVESLRYE
jgi:putative ABC transport system permease protein